MLVIGDPGSVNMADASSFTSLFALVDSHLSKTEVQKQDGDRSVPAGVGIPIPSLQGAQRGTSDTCVGPSFKVPRLTPSDNSITDILSMQLANMFKAQELKKQQEKELEIQKLEEDLRRLRLEEENCIIDLMPAVRKPGQAFPIFSETLSSSSSCESILDQPEFNIGPHSSSPKVAVPPPEPLLPCKTDMSYILKQKVKRGKCSAFGRVVTSRLRPVAAPYLRVKSIVATVKRFDFSTKSPCDIIKEKLRKPSSYSQSEDPVVSLFNMEV